MIARIDSKHLFYVGLIGCYFFLFTKGAHAQPSTRIGKVISTTDQKPLLGVTVLNLSTQLAEHTDQEGNFSIRAAVGIDSSSL
ncbi:carboxypeptidase-like regulatory domain-containing protein [Sphingobacterium sp. E70]|uniref:carboxypeptidase-like regulatory domain-containing protein n=1 Tax=Sphingobacterium sp. E70 TaxID=2853439 RepID=UPI00211C217C|nr:carboxypeptidase-like regulatory domain-containing protein [Sphingobacterium sp. E70]ULT25583.1 carboxypeptidase-like regulatory domain-containing protein [Sphingobacterium sp. E70]